MLPATHRAGRRRPPTEDPPPPDVRRRPGRGRLRLLPPLLAVGLLVLTAGTAGATTRHGDSGTDASHSIAVTAEDFSYALSTTEVASGLVRIRLDNEGSQPHQAQIGRFKPGVGVAQFEALVKAGQPDKVIPLFDGFYGGPNAILSGDSQTTFQNLPPGHYLMLCFVPDPATGMPHFAMGMYAGFDVVGSPDSRGMDAAQTVYAVDDLQFDIPGTLQTDRIVRYENRSTKDVHEFSIGRLHEGKTAADVVTWAQHPGGPPPYDEMGGAGAVNPGGEEWFTLHLPPGDYLAYCLVPDDETGQAHAAMGMVKTFTVVDD